MAREADRHAETEQESRGPGPGELLQSERDRRNLSIAQVAHELHLSASLVEALERNDFSPLGAPIYIRGHLKNYARLLEFDVDSVMAAYDRIAEWRDPEIDTQQPKGPPVETGSRRWVSVVSWLVVAALLVSLTLWGYHRLERLPEPPPTSAGTETADRLDRPPVGDSSATADDAPASAEKATDRPAGTADGVTGETEHGPGDETAVDDKTTGGEGDGSETAPDNGASDPSMPDREAVDDARSEPGSDEPRNETGPADRSGEASAAGAARADTVSDASGDRKPVSGPEAHLTLTLEGESWVEVYDANDRRLVYKLLRDGDERRVSGVAPLRVFLGNAPVVEARANDRPVDVASRVRSDKTAYFVIPAPSDRQQ